MPTKSPYSGGRFTLELDGKKPVGFVTSIDGGHFKADPVTSQIGADEVVTHYPGRPKFEDITITCGMAMSPEFWGWVKSTLDGKPQRRNGALVGYDFNNKERSRRTFYDALIAEVGFPALDSASKAGAHLTLKISPERIEYQEGDNSSLQITEAQNEVAKQKLWLSNNFTFSLDSVGIEELRSAKIDAFAVKQNIIQNAVGSDRIARKEVGRIELPQLHVSFPETFLGPWMKWYEKTVKKGDYQDTTAHLTYYQSNGQGTQSRTELMRLDFDGVGLTSLEIEKYEAHKEGLARAKATLYFEGVQVKTGKGNA